MKKREAQTRGDGPEQAVLGLEAEFVCVVDGEPVDPAREFGDPRTFLGPNLLHRTGTSYHLGTGGAVYFDTGVIEVVTPIVELAPGAPSRAVRSLWEAVAEVRQGLDRWERKTGRSASLGGFSAHYNVSVPGLAAGARTKELAWLLIHMLPFPMLLFATNRRSTGVGVRPRPGRIEVTVDFTSDPAMATAAAALVAAAVAEVADWPETDPGRLVSRGFPVLGELRPVPHTSRKGWLVQSQSFESDPFRSDPDARQWSLHDGEVVSLRETVRRCLRMLEPRLREIAEPETVEFMHRVASGDHPSFLDLEDRPVSYDNVGRVSLWRERDPARPLPRSLYEQAMRNAARREPLVARGRRWHPVGTRGWTRILYRSDSGERRLFTVDEIVRLRRS